MVLPSYDSRQLTVLIVDDSTDDAVLLSRSLQRIGIDNTFRVRKGEDAITWLETNPCQLLIAEYRLPGMNGAQLLEALSREGRPPATIVVSRAWDLRLVVEVIKQGATDFLAKDEYLSSSIARSVQTVLRQLTKNSEDDQLVAIDAPNEKLRVALAEAQWLLKSFRGPHGISRFMQPGDRDDLLGTWSDAVDTFRTFLERSLHFFPDILLREEETLIHMIVDRGFSPRDTVTLFHLALLALKQPEERAVFEPRVGPSIILSRILARVIEEYQRSFTDEWLRAS